MGLLEYYANLRKELLSQIGWTVDAYSDWTHTCSNKKTQYYLVLLLDNYVSKAKPFGVYLVTEYHKGERYRWNSDGITIEDEKPVVQGDPDYLWGAQMYHGIMRHRRPYLYDGSLRSDAVAGAFNARDYMLSQIRQARELEHEKEEDALVIETLIYKKDKPASELINAVLGDIARATASAQERQPRSGIREYLLRAVLRLNDAILPFTVDEYLEHLNTLKE